MCEGVGKTEGGGNTPKMEYLTQDKDDFDPTNNSNSPSDDLQKKVSDLLSKQDSAFGFSSNSPSDDLQKKVSDLLSK